jgi:hypothetical protein
VTGVTNNIDLALDRRARSDPDAEPLELLDDGDGVTNDYDTSHVGEMLLWERPQSRFDPHVWIGKGDRTCLPVLGFGKDDALAWLRANNWGNEGKRPSHYENGTLKPKAVFVEYCHCGQPLELDWTGTCEFPYQPGVWWRDDRSEHCRCNGCLQRGGKGGRHSSPRCEADFDNWRDQWRRIANGAVPRGEIHPVVAYNADMISRARRTEFDLARYHPDWRGRPFRWRDNPYDGGVWARDYSGIETKRLYRVSNITLEEYAVTG